MKKNVFLFIAIFGMFVFLSCDTNKEVLKDVPVDQLEKTITLTMSDTLKIEIPTNPTTGFKWYLVNKIKPKTIEELDRKFVENEETMDMVGGGGMDIWRFLPVKKGTTYLHFKYMREDGKTKKENYYKIIVE